MNKFKNITYLCIFTVGLWILSSCNADFVNTVPLEEVNSEDVWSDPALAEAAVTGAYAGLGQGGFDEQMLASLTDEAIFTHPGRDITVITESRSNPAAPGWINNTLEWGNMYSYIRACNVAIENLSEPLIADQDLVDRLMGEAKFMRAYYSHQLLRYYGAFPIVDRAYELGEDSYEIPRNTWEECIDFIIGDLDEAAALMEGKSMDEGRASRMAALALKSRILLYAASDLHDIPTASSQSSLISGYANPEYLGYTSGDRMSRWQRAKDAAKVVLDNDQGNLLNLSAPVSHEEGIQNYMNNSLSKNGGEEELIFARYFINAKQENGGRQGLFNGPNGYNNWAGNTPIQHFVDDYEMMDGTEFDWDNPAHAEAPYENRDARFYASLLYDGAQWKPRSSANQSKDPLGQIQTGQYEIMQNGSVETHFGLDTRNSSIEDWNGSYTGYYIRKFTNPDPAIVDQNTWQEIPWPFLRYTEAVLNYVEACIELGQEEEARTWLNRIRYRVGMPAINDSGEALMDRYRNERRIEMAYEEQRYHDCRRWMIPEETLGRKANGINIVGEFKPGESLSLYRYDTEIYDYSYQVTPIDPGKENRQWLDKMYFLPIHQNEMNRNAQLVQNPGYTE
ncbi:RagB/SusD family nutrient uptake outer membrane protein [Echinicola strongylocentroti]|uniref:RagB/SusD family nutrient uptake outer membrane protein n=1 Tax=Echinicola strongylocentroti TaxID=1795355 RepID=A0A2Z4IQK2_9BACT|nr:RagB/SusD family nutrient uptake outer membrane protein [Echinicola strongylocentroti]AWW33094.1 RagB/SusD family nutrient uptake outer membrane protein [Echinicola strongylocentroti]